MRTSAPEQIHLTLHFLGNVEPARVDSIAEALAPIAARHGKFELRASGVSAFGETHRPKVLWAGFGPAGLDQLNALRQGTGEALRGAGFEIDNEFAPHLTLGRVRRPLRSEGRRALQQWYAKWTNAEFGALPVEAMHLMRSQLGTGPAQHSVVRSFELQ